MFNLRIQMPILEFQVSKFSKRMREVIRRRLRVAARSFARAALLNVPVQSGMARGSFLNIGRLLRRIKIEITPTVSNAYTYQYGGKQLKTPELGASLSTPPDQILTENGDTFTFYFSTGVIHYAINEFYGRIPSAPWLSFAFGRAAYIEQMKKLPKYLPNVKDYIVVSILEGGPDGAKIIATKIPTEPGFSEDEDGNG